MENANDYIEKFKRSQEVVKDKAELFKTAGLEIDVNPENGGISIKSDGSSLGDDSLLSVVMEVMADTDLDFNLKTADRQIDLDMDQE